VVLDGLNAAYVPARGHDCASTAEGPAIRVPDHVADPRLATSAGALDGTADGNARLSPSICAPESLDGFSDDELLLEAAVGRGEHAAGTRTLGPPARSRPPNASAITPGGAAYRELVMTVITQRLSGETACISRAAKLLSELGLRDRTAVAKGSKWRSISNTVKSPALNPSLLRRAIFSGISDGCLSNGSEKLALSPTLL
jgi:hypothetical protein